jgi:Domain of unknown function (DUF5916)/Carbohydrate family 9 binding domain-like
MSRAVLSLVLCLALAAATAASQPQDLEAIRAAKQARALAIDEPIQIDGVLDEPAWERTEATTDFYQQQPAEFELATRRTEVRFLYDRSKLYVGAVLYDPEPDRLITNELKRDFGGSSGDGFGVILDTFQDRRNAVGFLTNPGGAQRDSLGYENGRRNDANWHGAWSVKTHIRPDGWSLEFAIPFKTLRFPDGAMQTWGLNMVRWARRANETSTWAPVPRQFSHYNVAYAGTIAGIADVRPGRNLQIKPFATADVSRGSGGRRVLSGEADGGVDVKWGVTSSLLLDASWRTDFSQVEADEQQINLTRFSQFFPEKREFFLENPSAFQIGLLENDNENPRRDLVPFFSRRIGLSGDGQPIPVIGGLRLTGRTARQGIGMLMMQTEDFESRPGDNFIASRISHDLTSEATVAGFYFGREAANAPSFNRVGGFDVRLRPRQTLELEAFAMGSGSDTTTADWAGRAGLRLDARRHRARAGFLHIGDEFRHDLGFVRRRGVGTLFGRYARVFRPRNTAAPLREWSLGADAESTTDDRYSTLLTNVATANYEMLFADSAELRVWGRHTFERIASPFAIGTLTVPPGQYQFDDGGVEFRSNRSAALSGSAELIAGEFWTGRQRSVSGSVRLRLNAHLALSTSLSRSLITLPDGSFTGDLVGLRADWSVTPRMFLNAFVQYNGETDTWLTNIRYNFIHRPLSDIYLVWNETRSAAITRRALLLKYTYMLAM